MRNIDSIIVHCSATKAGLDFTATDIDRWHRERGFNGIGYHYVIRLDGKLEKGRDVTLAGAHCKGWNERSVGICYIGGLDENGRPADTRTNVQKRVLYQIIMDLQREYNILQVLGHRDTSPDLNGDGVIEPYEYVKACPCFDVKEFLRSGRELLFVLLGALVVPVLLSGCRSKKEVINRESEVRVDSSLNSSSGKSLVENKVASDKDSEVVEEHIEQVVELAKDNAAAGVVILLAKFCDPEEFEAPLVKKALGKAGIPAVTIEVDQSTESYEQARTQLETFADLLG